MLTNGKTHKTERSIAFRPGKAHQSQKGNSKHLWNNPTKRNRNQENQQAKTDRSTISSTKSITTAAITTTTPTTITTTANSRTSTNKQRK